LLARRSAEGGAGGADFALGGSVAAGPGGADLAVGNSDLIGSVPPLPKRVASSVAAACKSSKHGSVPTVAAQRARARR